MREKREEVEFARGGGISKGRDFIYNDGMQSLTYYIVVHGYRTITKYDELLNERRIGFLLPYQFQNYAICPLHGFGKIFSRHKSCNIWEREKSLLRYNKLGQTRWLIKRICENCKRVWKFFKKCVQLIKWWFIIKGLLSVMPIHASETSKVEHQDILYGMLFDKSLVEFYGLF